MPKAVITTKSGATVAIEGSQEEVRALLALFEPSAATSKMEGKSLAQTKSKPTPAGLLSEFISEGFFSTPKGLGAVREALENMGHFYPVTTLSPVLLRFVRKKELRRLKDRGHWSYVA